MNISPLILTGIISRIEELEKAWKDLIPSDDERNDTYEEMYYTFESKFESAFELVYDAIDLLKDIVQQDDDEFH